tara:strand:+ start:144 stop:461 length:318 start_codon:yes stop_codon:yes gene_type:complete
MVNIHYSFLNTKDKKREFKNLLDDLEARNLKNTDNVSFFHKSSFERKQILFNTYFEIVDHCLWSAVEANGMGYETIERVIDQFLDNEEIEELNYDDLQDEFMQML